MSRTSSWGRVSQAASLVVEPAFRDELRLAAGSGQSTLGFGLGRSYGDVGLNDGGTLVRMPRLDRIIASDWQAGVVRAEAGLSIGALLGLAVPNGWFVPVTPGTKFVTLGGAVANDVHGKNHHEAGTFGCHVRALGLLRSEGGLVEIGPEREPDLFAATVGGLGLTGLIVWVELQMHRIASSDFEVETKRLAGLDDFFEVAEASGAWPYTVAWVDCLASGPALGRGLFSRGRHAPDGPLIAHSDRPRPGVPIDAPSFLLGPATVRTFNALYARQPGTDRPKRIAYDPFLYPLDGIGAWNRLYGRGGFFQHQSVVPAETAHRALKRLLEETSKADQGSFLVVLKLFGPRASPGLMSFPREGATFALDLPNRGAVTRDLLRRMGDIVLEEGGRLYPAKDATMTGEQFRAGYPAWRRLDAARDPAINSDFWRRVTRDDSMSDQATGSKPAARTILVLGATSAIATALCRRRAAKGARFVLVARHAERLAAVQADLLGRGASEIVTLVSDLADMTGCAARFDAFTAALAAPDEVLLAYGVLGDQASAESDPDETRRLIDVNFTSAALWLQLCAQHLGRARPCALVVIGSVAGDRGRQSNYVYGAAKAGLDAFAEGLAHRAHGSKLQVLTVKPGFVDTPMTAHLDRSGPLWAKPEAIAAAIDGALAKGRRVVYAPWFWWPIMTAVRLAPRPLFYRTKL